MAAVELTAVIFAFFAIRNVAGYKASLIVLAAILVLLILWVFATREQEVIFVSSATALGVACMALREFFLLSFFLAVLSLFSGSISFFNISMRRKEKLAVLGTTTAATFLLLLLAESFFR